MCVCVRDQTLRTHILLHLLRKFGGLGEFPYQASEMRSISWLLRNSRSAKEEAWCHWNALISWVCESECEWEAESESSKYCSRMMRKCIKEKEFVCVRESHFEGWVCLRWGEREEAMTFISANTFTVACSTSGDVPLTKKCEKSGWRWEERLMKTKRNSHTHPAHTQTEWERDLKSSPTLTFKKFGKVPGTPIWKNNSANRLSIGNFPFSKRTMWCESKPQLHWHVPAPKVNAPLPLRCLGVCVCVRERKRGREIEK